MADHSHGSSLLKTPEAARRLGLATGTLQNLRSRGHGPAFVRLGKAIRYRPEDLAAYIQAHRSA